MLTMEMVLHKDVDFAPKFGKNHNPAGRFGLLSYNTNRPFASGKPSVCEW